jgi:hypothetical protein
LLRKIKFIIIIIIIIIFSNRSIVYIIFNSFLSIVIAQHSSPQPNVGRWSPQKQGRCGVLAQKLKSGSLQHKPKFVAAKVLPSAALLVDVS